MKRKRGGNGHKRFSQHGRERDLQVEYLQKAIAIERCSIKTLPSPLAEGAISNAFPKSIITTDQSTRSAIPPSIEPKEEKNRVIEWIKECGKPETLDLIDDEPRPKAQGTYYQAQGR
jgi:hypothetical protein